MKTKILTSKNNFKEIVKVSSDLLLKGEIIAFPTETVYGIGCLLNQTKSVEKIFELKGRNKRKPLAVHISDLSMVDQLSGNVPDVFYKIAEKFMPGPISIIIDKKESVSDMITSGLNSIGVRFPDNEIFNAICKNAGQPIVATSANISGEISSVDANSVVKSFNGKIPLIIDDGETKYKQDSTVIKISGNKISVLRNGAIDIENFEEFF